MREYRFRGKRSDNGEWVYGYYYTQIITHAGNKKSRDHFIRTEQNTEQNIRYEVDPDTVGQYTGLHDKNGREIYEGDICMNSGMDWMGKQAICFEQATFKLGIQPLCAINIELLEVIGNVYDNPELLKEVD